MNSIKELQIRNEIYSMIHERRFAQDLYPMLNEAGYLVIRVDEVNEIIDDIIGMFMANNINPNDFGLPTEPVPV